MLEARGHLVRAPAVHWYVHHVRGVESSCAFPFQQALRNRRRRRRRRRCRRRRNVSIVTKTPASRQRLLETNDAIAMRGEGGIAPPAEALHGGPDRRTVPTKRTVRAVANAGRHAERCPSADVPRKAHRWEEAEDRGGFDMDAVLVDQNRGRDVRRRSVSAQKHLAKGALDRTKANAIDHVPLQHKLG